MGNVSNIRFLLRLAQTGPGGLHHAQRFHLREFRHRVYRPALDQQGTQRLSKPIDRFVA